ncbi:DUF2934 domain-containing protein [Azospirillum sp. RWY-5-1]|uniref:DUF2934 domain-containing protein n=1 Tax=Azospirillum oleiclasticum TaxID=2735135 RepID=A0ABX2T5D7_9PROT|nr:DUF2934 domain-containing protein [Azospirillum oleiclasticum]NYZ10962.1 DUF2934 domain-containing protein [Azospirillum oleiclasticum]NYZ18124.1 DUF2934 domain-containing protein [Azospirillum oleiclasticum]
MAAKRKPANTQPTAEAGASEAGAEAILKTNFSDPEKDAFTLMSAASLLSEADSPDKVNVALDHNLKLWIAIKTVIQDGGNSLASEVKDNLRQLSQWVATTTMEASSGEFEGSKLIALARVNMHIAEGLVRGQQNKMVEERAYQIWEEEGCPEGKQLDHWLRAEQEVAELSKLH